MINTDGLLAAVRVCKQPATGQGIFLGLIFLSFVSLLLSRGTDMQPSAWPAGWMPAQVPSPRWKSHLQPDSQSPKVKKTEIFPSQIAALPGASSRGSHLLRARCRGTRGRGDPPWPWGFSYQHP